MSFRRIILTIGLMCIAKAAIADIARPGIHKYTQPDGTVVNIEIHGDEFFHWTTIDGKTVSLDDSGYYRPESEAKLQARRAAGVERRNESINRVSSDLKPFGTKKFLVLLVEFSDLTFSVSDPKTKFYNMLNKTGYSENGGIGSARDYYIDNSGGLFTPEFDVVGPVQLDYPYSTYGRNNSSGSDIDPQRAIYEACLKADPMVDFSKYDLDGNGYVDNVYVFYAGAAESNGGSSDTIWPHQWSVFYYDCRCDGVKIVRYACSAELTYGIGSDMCGIGTFCHEFGHVIGLPDLYDTDYSKNGQAEHLYQYSLMAGGNHNSNGRKPPYLNCVERNLLGWMDKPEEWTSSGNKSIAAIQNNVAYYSKTSMDGEIFIYETRSGTGWDQAVSPGLLIYHLDQSNRSVGGSTPASKWASRDQINTIGSHPCFYIVKATDYVYTFGGDSGKTSFTKQSNPGAIDWNNCFIGHNLTNIKYANGVTTLTLDVDYTRQLTGKVVAANGLALANATISIVPVKASSTQVVDKRNEAPIIGKQDFDELRKQAKYITTTDSKGCYSIPLMDISETSFRVIASIEGYVSQAKDIEIALGDRTVNFSLAPIFNAESSDLKKHGNIGRYSIGYTNYSVPYSIMTAARFKAAELENYVGDRISSVSFYFNGTNADAVYVIIDFGSTRAVSYQVENVKYGETNTVDISHLGLTVPASTDVYIGYALQNINTQYPLASDSSSAVDGGMMISGFSLYNSYWSSYSANAIVSAKLTPARKPLSSLGFNVIKNPKNSYNSGDFFEFALENGNTMVESIKWYYDGKAQTASKIVLKTGQHVVKAEIENYDGSKEILQLTVIVK